MYEMSIRYKLNKNKLVKIFSHIGHSIDRNKFITRYFKLQADFALIFSLHK